MAAPDKAVITLAGKSTGNIANFSGTWQNELESRMTIEVIGTEVTGTYTTARSASGGSLPPHQLNGCVDGNLISFTVNWTDKAAITAWVGQLLGVDKLYTLWQMTLQVDDPGKNFWEAIWAGSDTFDRVP